MRVPWLLVLAACSPLRHAEPLDDTVKVLSGGVERIAIVHLPGKSAPVPLVLSLHPSGSTAAGQRAAAHLDELADREGFAVAYPQAAIALSGGFQWHLPGQPLVGGDPEPASPDDVAYIADVIRSIADRFAIDTRRVYATGFSGGARMASQLGCDLSAIAAIAPISGVRFPDHCMRNDQSVIAFHGTADTTNPYDGNGSAYWTYSVLTAMQRWATNDGCDPTPAVSRAAATVGRTAYHGCRGGVDVELYSLEGEGHDVPHAIDANRVMWTAFQLHALP